MDHDVQPLVIATAARQLDLVHHERHASCGNQLEEILDDAYRNRAENRCIHSTLHSLTSSAVCCVCGAAPWESNRSAAAPPGRRIRYHRPTSLDAPRLSPDRPA